MSDLIPYHAEDAFILIRHAATVPNLFRQTCGSIKAAIMANAEAETVLLGQTLRSAIPRPARIYHTGMRRSLQTAMALASS
jgi:broad specificity phosphatase PhoE